MIGLIQRVTQAKVEIDGVIVGEIAGGLLLFQCVEQNDTTKEADKLLDKVLKLRIFSDENGKMNRSVLNLDGNGKAGDLLIVSQFTLAADVSSGTRPGFSAAASPQKGQELYEYFIAQARQQPLHHIATGSFGADMQITLTNDGPVTIPIHIAPAKYSNSSNE